ncbi:MAG: pyruvate, water dikinase regulatory protein [Hydrotalea sp.]|nr:pyruvate, water dikinase regulatory protein [Hydrotalea sp.]
MTDIKKVLLISDSTGETLQSLAAAVKAQFAFPIEDELEPLIRSRLALEAMLAKIDGKINKEKKRPDLILYTLVEQDLIKMLDEFSIKHDIPVIDVLNPLINKYAMVFHAESLLTQKKSTPGGQHSLDRAYFERIEAMDFAKNHDDGMNVENLIAADVVILGVSRSSKSPTASYLANHRGLKVANIPFLTRAQLPKQIFDLSTNIKNGKWQKTMIVGLTKRPEDLLEIRKSRLNLLGQVGYSGYTDIEKIIAESEDFKKLCHQEHWPIIDVTHKSIEETAAHIVRKWQDRQDASDAAANDAK